MVILPSIRRKYMVSRLPKGATVPMSDCVVTLAADSTSYTGSARTVGVTVTWEGATLTVNTDYTLAYSNNVDIGPATVTVTGMGQFAGSVTKTFYIIAEAGEWAFDISKTSDEPLETYEVAALGNYQGMRLHVFDGGFITSPGANGSFTRYELPSLDSSSSGISNSVGGGISMAGTHFVCFQTRSSGVLYHAEANPPNAVSGLSFSSVRSGVSTGASRKCVISGDGMHMFMIGEFDYGNHGKIYRHDMTTAYDFSTLSVDHDNTINFGYATYGKYQDFCFSPNGRKMLWYDSNTAYVFDLATAWDPSMATLSKSKAFSSSLTYPAVAVNEAGTRLYLAGGGYLRVFALTA